MTIKLTRREREILGEFYDGLSSPKVAEKLRISIKTVYQHTMIIKGKLGAETKEEMIGNAIELELIIPRSRVVSN